MSTPTIYAAAARRQPARLTSPRPAEEDRKPNARAYYFLYPGDHWNVHVDANGASIQTRHDAAAIDRRRIKNMAKAGLCHLTIYPTRTAS